MATEAIDLTQRGAKVTGREVLEAVVRLGDELAERDDELRDVLGRLARMVGSLRDSVASLPGAGGGASSDLELGMQALVQSVDTLVGVDTVASERMATLSTSVDRLAEAVTTLGSRIERIDHRIGDLEARVAPEALVEQVDDTGALEMGELLDD